MGQAGRQYLETHPWIAFTTDRDLRTASSRFWMLLGEAKSKCDHIKYVPLARGTAEDLHRVYFAKGVMATTAIEGNTLSEEEVARRIAGNLRLPRSKEYLGVEVDNMLAAYNGIIDRVRRGESVRLDVETLCALNKQILNDLNVEESVVPGQLRQHRVVVGSYLGAPPEDIPYLMAQLCQWLEGWDLGDEHERVPRAFIKAVVAHLYIEWIHPFGDGNGRLGRLVEFQVLISAGVPLPAAHVLTSHYNDTRTEYYRQLQAASRSGGDLRGFLMYAAQGFVDGLTAAIRRLHKQQEQLMWQAMVDENFHGKISAAAHRQRHLAIELGGRGWVARRDVRALHPDLAAAYGGKGPKTLTRDLNKLAELDLVETAPTEVRARIELVRGMRPFVVVENS